MAVFEYQAIAKTGKSVKGVIDADSAAVARRKLREQDLFPTDVRQAAEGRSDQGDSNLLAKFSRVSTRELALATRQLGTLLQAGMPLVDSMTAMLEQTTNRTLRRALYTVRDRVSEGKGLGDSLAQHPSIFNELFVNMVRAGETSGALEQVLFRLADVQERQSKLNARVMSALLYPSIMALFAVGVVVILMTIVVPRVTALFMQQDDMVLPTSTRLLIVSSDFLRDYWIVLVIILIMLIVIWRAWLARPQGRLAWDTFKLKVPVLGALYVKIICTRLSRTLGTMLQNGLTMMNALDIVKTVVQNRRVEEVVETVKAEVRRGRDLSEPLRTSGIFPPLLVHMVELGQRSGELEDMLIRVADTYEDDVTLTVDAAVGLIEPLIIIVMGVVVGFLVVSILLPILQITTAMGG